MRCFAFLLFVLPVFSLHSQALDLPALVQSALKQSEALASDSESLVQAEQRYAQAMGSLAPSLSLGALYGRQDDSKVTAGGEQGYAKLSLNQPLLRGFREYAAIRAAEASLAYQKEARRWGRSRAALDVAQAYYNVLALGVDQGIVDEQVQLYEKRINDLRSWVGIGRSRPGEVLNVQAAQAALRAQLQQLGAQQAVARELLAFLTGLEGSQELDTVGNSLPALPELSVLLKGVEQRPDLLAAMRNAELAQAQVGVARGGHGPSVDLNANYYPWRLGSQKDVAWDAALSATLPLFAGFTVSSQVKQAESAARQSELALSRLRRSAAQELRTLHTSLAADLAQCQVLEEAQGLAEKSSLADAKDYNLGLVNNLQVLQSLANAKETGRALNRARFAAQADARRLAAAAGADADLLGAR